jgi:hypothetical protein
MNGNRTYIGNRDSECREVARCASSNWCTVNSRQSHFQGSMNGMGTHKSESNPSMSLVQGPEKEDCVTVWFLFLNVNRMKSPGCATYKKGASTLNTSQDGMRTTYSYRGHIDQRPIVASHLDLMYHGRG